MHEGGNQDWPSRLLSPSIRTLSLSITSASKALSSSLRLTSYSSLNGELAVIALLPLTETPLQSRLSLKEEAAEFLGAFTIILFGAGAQCQAQLYPDASSVSRLS